MMCSHYPYRNNNPAFQPTVNQATTGESNLPNTRAWSSQDISTWNTLRSIFQDSLTAGLYSKEGVNPDGIPVDEAGQDMRLMEDILAEVARSSSGQDTSGDGLEDSNVRAKLC